MNKIVIVIGFMLMLGNLLCLKVQAQSISSLVAVEYEGVEQLNELFPYSSRVLLYLNAEDFDAAIFLALMTDENIQKIQKLNYRVSIIDESPDLERYVVLYHPMDNQGDLLKEFGDVKQITKRHTLLHLHEGKEFSHEGVGAQFFESPFLENITPPPLATPVLPITTTTDKKEDSRRYSTNSNGLILLISIVITLFAGFIIGVIWYIKRKRDNTPTF